MRRRRRRVKRRQRKQQKGLKAIVKLCPLHERHNTDKKHKKTTVNVFKWQQKKKCYKENRKEETEMFIFRVAFIVFFLTF